MKNYYTYMTINNLDTTKCYVGMSVKPISTGYKGSGKYIGVALNKYGRENFIRTDLGVFNNKDECHYWEGFYIKVYKTLKSDGGYNISPNGGMHGYNSQSDESKELNRLAHLGKKTSKETKAKISLNSGVHKPGVNESRSAALKGRQSPMKGRHQSEESKNKIREKLIGRTSPMKGRHHSDISKHNISIHSDPNNKGRFGNRPTCKRKLK